MKIPIYKNTLTNYLRSFVYLAEGILVTRWLINRMGMEYYGLWMLFWSFFVYGLLLDFGCGLAAQKYSAGNLYETDAGKYSRIISTIFTFYLLAALVIAGVSYGLSFFMPWIVKTGDPELLAYAKRCFILFGLGAAVNFPMGMFSEMLVGFQKLYLRNYIQLIAKVLELCGVFLLLWGGYRLIPLIVFTMLLSFSANAAMMVSVLRQRPRMKLRIRLYRDCFHEIFSFSLFIYLTSISKLIINKTSNLIISIFCGLQSVGEYRASGKVGDLCFIATSQYQENVAPISSALFKRKHIAALRRILFNSIRWNSILATVLIFISAMLINPILDVLFKIHVPYVSYLSILFLVSIYIELTARVIPMNFFNMTEQHKFATAASITEASVSLAITLICMSLGAKVEAILWSSIGVRSVICLFAILPRLLRFLRVSPFVYFWRIFGAQWVACILPALWLLWIRNAMANSPFLLCVVGGSVALILYLPCVLIFLPKGTVRMMTARVKRMIRKKKASGLN